VTRLSGAKFFPALDPRGLAAYLLDLVVVGVTYFGLAHISLTVASIHSSAIPIWAPAGLGFAAILLCGIRVWPAIFAAAYAASVPTDLVNANAADSITMSLAVAAGSTLAPVVGGYLLNIWSGGRKTFDTPARVAKFALVVLATTTTSDRRCWQLVSCRIPRMERRLCRVDDVVAARCGRRARCCAGCRAVGARRFPTFQAEQDPGVRHRTRHGGRRGRHRL
jgi:hypothetical protein